MRRNTPPSSGSDGVGETFGDPDEGMFRRRALRLPIWVAGPGTSTGELALSAEAQRIVSGAEFDGTFVCWLRFVDPANAERLQRLEEEVRGGQRSFRFE